MTDDIMCPDCNAVRFRLEPEQNGEIMMNVLKPVLNEENFFSKDHRNCDICGAFLVRRSVWR